MENKRKAELARDKMKSQLCQKSNKTQQTSEPADQGIKSQITVLRMIKKHLCKGAKLYTLYKFTEINLKT